MDSNDLQEFAYFMRKAFATVVNAHGLIIVNNEPTLDDNLHEMITALDTTKEHAQIIAEYYNTLTKNNIPSDDALELTIVHSQNLFESVQNMNGGNSDDGS